MMEYDRLHSRYHRQIILNRFGIEAQERLQNAKVLVIGAGGLSCPALQYLCGAGVGKMGIVDCDVVLLSNLHRQILFTIDDIGKNKAVAAVERLQLLNDTIELQAYPNYISVDEAITLIGGYDYIFDGTDDIAVRYLVNDVCVLLKKPLIYGAVSGYEGQVSVFNCKKQDGSVSGNYRDVFGHQLSNENMVTCEAGGVMGVLPGQTGILMATELIKLITGIGDVLTDRLLVFNILENRSFEISYSASGDTLLAIPSSIDQLHKTVYSLQCDKEDNVQHITVKEMEVLLAAGDTELIDIRALDEQPRLKRYEHLSIEMSQLLSGYNTILSKQKIILVCQSGKRSAVATRELSLLLGHSKSIFSLSGGVMQLISENRV